MVEIIVRHNDDGVDKGEETVSVDVTEVGQRRRWSWGKVDSGGGEWIVAMEMVEMGTDVGEGTVAVEMTDMTHCRRRWGRRDRVGGDDVVEWIAAVEMGESRWRWWRWAVSVELGAMEPCRWR